MTNSFVREEHITEIMNHLHDEEIRLIVEILLETGYRIDDVMHLRGRDLSGNRLTITEQKTGNERSADLSPELADRLRERLGHGNAYVWRCRQPRRGRRAKMHRTTVWRAWEAAVSAAGFEGCGYTLHSLRKVYAVRALRRLGSLEAVRVDLGHTSMSTTLLYALSDYLFERNRF